VYRGSKKGAWRIDLDNPTEIKRRLGEDAFIAFAKSFVGLDRVLTLRHLYELNAKHGAIGGSPAKERNAGLLLVLLVGTMHELGAALGHLQAILGRSRARTIPSWREIEALRRRWHGDGIGKDIRNQMAHHLGDREVYKKGLAMTAGKPRVCLYSAHGLASRDGAFEAPWNWVMHGLGLDSPGYTDRARQIVEDIRQVNDVLLLFFGEVINMAGIPVKDRRSK
jgi:hypothetical protein